MMLDFIKDNIKGFVAGVIVGLLLAPIGLGMMLPGTAQEMVDKASKTATINALVPICVANALNDPDKVTEVRTASSFNRTKMVSDAGWATYPAGASTSLKREINRDCANKIVS